MRRWLAVTALSCGLALTVPGAQATAADGPAEGRATTQATCPQSQTAQPLKDYYDDGFYYLVKNGSFAQGTSGWRTSGSVGVASQSEPEDVMGAGGGSLHLTSGSTATSDEFCTDSTHDRARMFYRGPGTPGSVLKVRITSRSNLRYSSSSYTVNYSLDGSRAGWRLSPTMVVPDWTDASGVQTTTITFEANGGPFLVDDVMVDPWRYNTQ